MNDAAKVAAGTPETEQLAPSSGLLDLSRQQRNLLLLRPLFVLELNKQRIGDEDSAPFQGIDTHYLVLSALDRMMEGTTVSTGCTSEEVLSHIADVASVMKPALTKSQLLKIAETVLAALDNKANQYKEFAFEHFDAARKGTRTVRFRLVTYEPDIEDVYRYKPTIVDPRRLAPLQPLEVPVRYLKRAQQPEHLRDMDVLLCRLQRQAPEETLRRDVLKRLPLLCCNRSHRRGGARPQRFFAESDACRC